MIETFFILLAAIAGALLNLWRGGQFFPAPKWLKLTACALPYGAAVAYAAGWNLDLARMPALWHGVDWALSLQIGMVLLALAGAFAATAAGHGAYFDLGHTRPEKPHDRIGEYQEESYPGWLVRKLDADGRLWGSRAYYEFLLLGILGASITLPAGVGMALVGAPGPGAAVALSGLLVKPLGYCVGWATSAGDRAIQVGEGATGALLYGSLALAVVAI